MSEPLVINTKLSHGQNSCSQNILVIPNYSISKSEDNFLIGGDQGQFVVGLLEHFRQVGVGCFTYHPPIARHTYLLPTKEGRVSVHNFGPWRNDFTRATKFKRYWEALVALSRTTKRYDLVYLFVPGWSAILAGLVCRFRQRPYALYARGGLEDSGPLVSRLYSWLASGASFCLSTGLGLRDRLLPFNDKTFPVSPMIPFSPADGCPPRKRQIEDPLRLLFTGTLRKSKGILDFLQAIHALQAEGLQVEAAVAGANDPTGEVCVDREIQSLSVAGIVKNYGFIKDRDRLEDLYRWADVLVFPTVYNEGFPRVIYEAMLFGTAVLTYDRDVLRSFLKNDVNSLLVETGARDELTRALFDLAVDPEKQNRLASCARTDVAQYLNAVGNTPHASQIWQIAKGNIPAN